jgi:hypothetical protein
MISFKTASKEELQFVLRCMLVATATHWQFRLFGNNYHERATAKKRGKYTAMQKGYNNGSSAHNLNLDAQTTQRGRHAVLHSLQHNNHYIPHRPSQQETAFLKRFAEQAAIISLNGVNWLVFTIKSASCFL